MKRILSKLVFSAFVLLSSASLMAVAPPQRINPPEPDEESSPAAVYLPFVNEGEERSGQNNAAQPAAPKQPRSTRTPGPTRTPVPIPPPTDYAMNNMMIVFGVMAVIVVIVGVWINRQRYS